MPLFFTPHPIQPTSTSPAGTRIDHSTIRSSLEQHAPTEFFEQLQELEDNYKRYFRDNQNIPSGSSKAEGGFKIEEVFIAHVNLMRSSNEQSDFILFRKEPTSSLYSVYYRLGWDYEEVGKADLNDKAQELSKFITLVDTGVDDTFLRSGYDSL